MPSSALRVELNKKFTYMLDSSTYYLLQGIIPLELLTKINPDQVEGN